MKVFHKAVMSLVTEGTKRTAIQSTFCSAARLSENNQVALKIEFGRSLEKSQKQRNGTITIYISYANTTAVKNVFLYQSNVSTIYLFKKLLEEGIRGKNILVS